MRAVARDIHGHTLKHWLAVRGILEYLKVTSSYGITFQRSSRVELVAYANAAYAPRDTRNKSVRDGAVMCGGAAIKWVSRTQKTSTLTTSEAEYVVMAEGSRRFFSAVSVDFMCPKMEKLLIQVNLFNCFGQMATMNRKINS